jgi:hypothetical protein
MYQSTWMQHMMCMYLKPGHYALYSYILTNEISHRRQTSHVSYILESEECKEWAMKYISRSDWALQCNKDYGRSI